MAKTLVDIQCEILNETDKAVRVENLKGESVWLPKSQIEIERASKAGGALLVMPEWLALKKELI